MKLVIKNLPLKVHLETIENLCSNYGRLMDCYILRKNSEGRAIAYVKMSTDEQEQKVIKLFNKSIFEGCILYAYLQKDPVKKKSIKKVKKA